MWFPAWTCCHLTPISMGMWPWHRHRQGNEGHMTGNYKMTDPKREKTDWPLSLPLWTLPPTTRTLTFYPHASLPSRAVRSHTLSQDPDFTQPIHCVSGNNPLSLCWWKVEVDGVRSVWRGKREECLAALFGNVVFSFPAVSGQWKSSASLSLPTKSSYWLFRYTRTTCSFKICHTHSVWQSGEVGFFFLLLP